MILLTELLKYQENRSVTYLDQKKMSKSREERINELIDDRSRPDMTARSEKLYNCDICFTCRLFNFSTKECLLTDEDVKEKAAPYLNLIEEEYGFYTDKTTIKEPTWYRCKMWEELKIT